jgi:hypothetical protein
MFLPFLRSLYDREKPQIVSINLVHIVALETVANYELTPIEHLVSSIYEDGIAVERSKCDVNLLCLHLI